MDAGDELLEAERLRHVVVRAQRQAAHAILDRVTRRQEQHRHVLTVASNPCLQLEAVRVRQHHVEHDQIGREIPHRGKRARAVRRRSNLEPLVTQSAVATSSAMFASSSTTSTRRFRGSYLVGGDFGFIWALHTLSRLRQRGAKAPLSRDAVVRAALDCLHEGGPAGLTMRKVAARLETRGPASLYVYGA